MVVRPADHLVREIGNTGESDDNRSREVEHDVVAGACQPDHHVVLRRRQDVTACAGERFVETRDAWRRGVRRDSRPQLRSKAGDQVHAADRRSRLAQRGHHGDGARCVCLGREIEL